ncbi:hypothetical protein VB005_00385 [Metarhizium brunneum]
MFAHSPILGAIISLALLAGPSAAAAAAVPDSMPALQPRITSGIDMNAACQWQYGGDYTSGTIGTGCYDWMCWKSGEQSGGLDLNAWCRRQHGPQSYASCSGGRYNWVCNY